MGGIGTFAAGNPVDHKNYDYKCVGYIKGIKILEGTGNKHSLPEESNSSLAYIKSKRRWLVQRNENL